MNDDGEAVRGAGRASLLSAGSLSRSRSPASDRRRPSACRCRSRRARRARASALRSSLRRTGRAPAPCRRPCVAPARSGYRQATTRSMSVSMLMPVWFSNSRCPFSCIGRARRSFWRSSEVMISWTSAKATSGGVARHEMRARRGRPGGRARRPGTRRSRPPARCPARRRAPGAKQSRNTGFCVVIDRASKAYTVDGNSLFQHVFALLDRPAGQPERDRR